MPTLSGPALGKALLTTTVLATLGALVGCASTPSQSTLSATPLPANSGAMTHAPRALSEQPPSAAAPSAAAAEAPADPMTLGAAAPAPLGYLRFCARRPDQCGVDPNALAGGDAGNQPLEAELINRYYWAVAFGGTGSPSTALAPTSGGADGRFDWSAVFGAVKPAPHPETDHEPAAVTMTPAFEEAPIAPALAAASSPDAAAGTLFDGAELAQDEGRGLLRTISYDDSSVNLTPDDLSPKMVFPSWSAKSQVVYSPAPSSGPVPAMAAPIATDAAAIPAKDSLAPTPLALDTALLTTLDAVNARVNRAIRYMSDVQQYGADDYWTLPLEPGGSAAGDCKDYVLEKRRALVAAGLPAEDLSIAIVKTGWGETHAVLLVSTSAGELVLDSLSPRVQAWRKVRYAWIERQAPGQQLRWVKIGAQKPA
jgi:predicted transglutaminase-like cysteine proteinase